MGLNAESIDDLEKFICENNSILDQISYEEQDIFKLKPGHKCFMLELPNQIREMTEKEDHHSTESFSFDRPSTFSHLLRMLINNAKHNSNKDPKGYRYDECIRYFATYIYIMCGKACYETLSANLPIPKPQTIRTYFLN